MKFAELAADKRTEFVEQIAEGPEDWSGRRAFLLFRVARRRGRRHYGRSRFRAAGHSVYAAYHSDQEVVAMASEKVDVVIVGGGASGILSRQARPGGQEGGDLEMGPPLALDDLVSSQICRGALMGGVPVVSEGKNPVAHISSRGWAGRRGDAPVRQLAAFTRRFPRQDPVRRGLDWPISYADVRPY